MAQTLLTLLRVLMILVAMTMMATTYLQYVHYKKHHHQQVLHLFRLQTGLIIIQQVGGYGALFLVRGFSKELLLLALLGLGLFVIVDFVIEHYLYQTNLCLWAISLYALSIGLMMISRLEMDLGFRQLYFAYGAYAIAFIITYLTKHIHFIHWMGIPAIVLAYTLLLLANDEINGANNWLKIGGFSFQPSEIVKVLYCLFLASIYYLLKEQKRVALFFSGIATSGLIIIQVFQRDLGSALIYYVMFILMTYLFTQNRIFIILGAVFTLIGGYFAYLEFYHVRTRIVAWLNPWSEDVIDGQGYQIAQSLFAVNDGGLLGRGLGQGMPRKIPVSESDFIYSAIFEEFGLIVALGLLFLLILFIAATAWTLYESQDLTYFYLGTGLLIVLAFQSFLIIAGVTKAIPLTGVTLPFVSYGGTSLITSFIMLGLLQGISRRSSKPREEEDHV